MIIRGGNEGGLDGIDVWGSNIHVHDVEVTNRDECVTVKVCGSVSFSLYFESRLRSREGAPLVGRVS